MLSWRAEEWTADQVAELRGLLGWPGRLVLTGSFTHGRREEAGDRRPVDVDVLLVSASASPRAFEPYRPPDGARVWFQQHPVDAWIVHPDDLDVEGQGHIFYDPDTGLVSGRGEAETYRGTFVREGGVWVKSDRKRPLPLYRKEGACWIKEPA